MGRGGEAGTLDEGEEVQEGRKIDRIGQFDLISGIGSWMIHIIYIYKFTEGRNVHSILSANTNRRRRRRRRRRSSSGSRCYSNNTKTG